VSHLDRRVFAITEVNDKTPEGHATAFIERDADTALTFRALIVVAVLCAGIWYLLWEISVRLLTGH
jgi:hypothetical protein